MANLKFNEKQLFEKLFDRGGYVLDFSNRTFEEFFNDFNIPIYSDKYSFNGDSKMKRLRAFWDIESNTKVGEVLMTLLNYAETKGNIEQKDKDLALTYINNLTGNTSSSASVKQEISEDDFLKKEFERIDLTLLNLGNLTETIEQRITEIQKCLKSNASLSVIFLCGSTLEGILLNQAIQSPKEFNTAISAPKDKDSKVKQFPDWTLNNFIDVAYEKRFIGLDVKKFSHSLRDFRNFIHPYEQHSLNFNPDKHTAKISWQVLQAVIDDLSKRNLNR
jgi:hypothetical protein